MIISQLALSLGAEVMIISPRENYVFKHSPTKVIMHVGKKNVYHRYIK